MSADQTPAAIEPDIKDWTFVIESGCTDCGFEPGYDVGLTGERVRAAAARWEQILAGAGAGRRPSPPMWSPLEYACHVRDTCAIFRGRLELMLTEDDPLFANWDQDAAAIEGHYAGQDPSAVADQLHAEALSLATAFDQVTGDQWDRPGRRSNGSVFTVRTLAIYFLHDIEHHLWDVAR